MSLLDIIRIELENMEEGEMPEPTGEIGVGEYFVGTANHKQKKLFTLAVRWVELANEYSNNALLANDPITKTHNLEKSLQFREKSELIMHIFWVSLKDDYPILWKKPVIKIKTGWDIVYTSPKLIIRM